MTAKKSEKTEQSELSTSDAKLVSQGVALGIDRSLLADLLAKFGPIILELILSILNRKVPSPVVMHGDGKETHRQSCLNTFNLVMAAMQTSADHFAQSCSHACDHEDCCAKVKEALVKALISCCCHEHCCKVEDEKG